jgi:hypothetical protein
MLKMSGTILYVITSDDLSVVLNVYKYKENSTFIQEEWRSTACLGYPFYEVSNFGRIRNINVNPVRMMQGSKIKSGYILVGLSNGDNKPKGHRVHILVAKLFLGQPPDKSYTVDHIDRLRDNNHLSNLRWATVSEQNKNREKKTAYKGRQVYQYDLKMNFIRKWETITMASRELKLTKQMISRACGLNIPYGGYFWKHCDKVDYFENEIWKPVDFLDYGTLYVSNLARVKKRSGKIVTGSKDDGGYMYVSIKCNSGSSVKIRIHRLVAFGFIGPYNQEMVINHKDGCKTNNDPNNLEIVTNKENIQHAIKTGLSDRSKAKNNFRPVLQYTLEGVFIARYFSIAEASRLTNINKVAISNVCRKVAHTSGDYLWKYETQAN